MSTLIEVIASLPFLVSLPLLLIISLLIFGPLIRLIWHDFKFGKNELERKKLKLEIIKLKYEIKKLSWEKSDRLKENEENIDNGPVISDEYVRQAEDIKVESSSNYNYDYYDFDDELTFFGRVGLGAFGGLAWAAIPFYEYMTKQNGGSELFFASVILTLSAIASGFFGGQSKFRSIILGILAPPTAILLVGILSTKT